MIQRTRPDVSGNQNRIGTDSTVDDFVMGLRDLHQAKRCNSISPKIPSLYRSKSSDDACLIITPCTVAAALAWVNVTALALDSAWSIAGEPDAAPIVKISPPSRTAFTDAGKVAFPEGEIDMVEPGTVSLKLAGEAFIVRLSILYYG